jgi:hypothetical protein
MRGAALVVLVLAQGGNAAAAPCRLPPADQPREVDTSAFLLRAMPIGNLGSITCNERRYAINSDWTLLAAPQDSGAVLMYDLATGRPAPPLAGGFKVGTFTYTYADGVPASDFGFSADGRFVIWSWGKKFVAWDVATRQVVFKQESERLSGDPALRERGIELSELTPARGASGPYAGSPTSSRDGRWSAVVNANDDVEVHAQLPAEAPALRVLPMREKGNRNRRGCTFFDFDRVRSGPRLLLSPDGQLLVDSCLVTDVWDLRQPVPQLLVRTGKLRQSAGSPVLSRDGRTIAYSWGGGSSLGGDGGFGLLDVGSASRIGLPVEVKYLGAMEFSPDGASLATVGWAPRPGSKRTFEVQIWSVAAIRSSGTAAR